jgi:hypothetical protein
MMKKLMTKRKIRDKKFQHLFFLKQLSPFLLALFLGEKGASNCDTQFFFSS